MKIILLVMISSLWLSGCNQSHKMDIPLKKGVNWYYLTKGYKSYSKHIRQEKISEKDSVSLDNFEISIDKIPTNKEIIKYDTICVNITNIDRINEQSILYNFNLDYIRFFGDKILKDDTGYMKYFHNGSSTPYIIKFPILEGHEWENKYNGIIEKCFISNVDTNLIFDGNRYDKCIKIMIIQKSENGVSNIVIYFNEKFGLIYYNDSNTLDEIRLLGMK